MLDRVQSLFPTLFIMMDGQFEPVLHSETIAKLDDVAELPGRIDMKEWERRRRRIKGAQREVG